MVTVNLDLVPRVLTLDDAIKFVEEVLVVLRKLVAGRVG
jgi:hypothetical protein